MATSPVWVIDAVSALTNDGRAIGRQRAARHGDPTLEDCGLPPVIDRNGVLLH